MLSKGLLISNVITILLCIGLYYLWDCEKEERIIAEQSLKTTKAALKTQREDFEQQSRELNGLNREFGKLSSEHSTAINKLNTYRDRENVAKKKPELVSRVANRAAKRLFNDICAATGGDCKAQTSKGSTSTTD